VLSRAQQKQLADLVEAWKRDHHTASARVETLEQELSGAKVDAATLARLSTQLAKAEAELADKRRERERGLQEESRLSERLADLERRLEQAEARRRELGEARDKLSVVRQLALDLRSDRFQAYLLEETFRELVEGASDRLMGLTNRYALQYDENSFHVVDHDNASERRRAETLSGGETFLASLCLALELSQQVQRAAGAVRLESLFIDEGFGTLDTETLGVIADAIESLPTAGRVVGIITHLGELTDRLPVCLRVEKGPEGSRVSLRAA
jgi:exonuclease SbcC